jgi:hypothetical protein
VHVLLERESRRTSYNRVACLQATTGRLPAGDVRMGNNTARTDNTMIALMIGCTAALGFLALGVGVFVLGKPSPARRPVAMQKRGYSLGLPTQAG